MKAGKENVDNIIIAWYNMNIKKGIERKNAQDAYKDCMKFARFVSDVFNDATDRHYAYDKFDELIHGEVKDE